jgi:broad specificity phosphatase PhoE
VYDVVIFKTFKKLRFRQVNIYLIRHGETDGNARRIMQSGDTPLNERGLAQAARLGRRLTGAGIHRIIASDYARARMTAEQIQATTGIALEFNELWRERNFGDLRGRPLEEVGDVYREDLDPPGGENWERFHSRVDRAWDWLHQAIVETEGNIAVVTHGMVCYSLALRRLQLAEAPLIPLRFGNTSLTIIGRVTPWTVQLLNCCAHLDETSASRQQASGV